MRVEQADSSGLRVIPQVARSVEPPLLVDENGKLITNAVVNIADASFNAAAPDLASARTVEWKSGDGQANTSPENLETLIGAPVATYARKVEVVNREDSSQTVLLGPNDGGATIPITPGGEYSIETPAGTRFLLSNWQVKTLSGTANVDVFYVQ